MRNPTSSSHWSRLAELQASFRYTRLADLFQSPENRFQKYSLLCNDLLIDYSKNFLDDRIISTLLQLAETQELPGAIQSLFKGTVLGNGLHPMPYTALRDRAPTRLRIAGEDICSQIRDNLFHMSRICREVRSWSWRGFSDKPISDVVTLGVGGAATDAQAVHKALESYQTNSLRVHFVSNSDSGHFIQLLSQLQRETTLFIISSKSFTTRETLNNARIARSWLLEFANTDSAMERHFIGITSNRKAALAFGINTSNVLEVWDWLPGRYSLWAAAGLPVALALGMEQFEEFLAGASLMDQHFLHTEMRGNAPVLLALISIWYTNFWHAQHHALLPYNEQLELLPGLIQHCLMEANGKSVDMQGEPTTYQTAPVIWGTAGNGSQHTYFQLLHQGTHNIPAEFIVVARDPLTGSNRDTFGQFLAQAAALMLGDTSAQRSPVGNECNDQILPGNKPSTSIVIKQLSPSSLGQLLALYEHIAYTRAIIWNINPFTHWGTELGKRYSNSFDEDRLEAGLPDQDSSTQGLLSIFKQWDSETNRVEADLTTSRDVPSHFF